MNVGIYWDSNIGAYRINFKYNVEFKDEFKKMIKEGGGAYGYDPVSKTWSFPENFLQQVIELAEQYYPGATIIIEDRKEVEEKEAKSAPAPLDKLQVAAVNFVARLDLRSLEIAYKTRCKTLHPDAGGNGAEFSEFNSAYQELRKEVK